MGNGQVPPAFNVQYQAAHNVLWGFFEPLIVPSFTGDLVRDLCVHDRSLQVDARGFLHTNLGQPVDYYVWASHTPGFYSLGGDLAYFSDCIERGDRHALMQYATQCIDGLFPRVSNYQAPRLITLALVQGDALGGGFEAALASDVLIAEEQSRFGLPEILFNLFPGMGGYSLLCRRIGSRLTEAMMLSGKIYSAAACHEMGIVDIVVAQGQGLQAVQAYVQTTGKRRNAVSAIYQARRTAMPVTRQELMAITTQWVDAALLLQDRELRLMKRMVQLQRAQMSRQR